MNFEKFEREFSDLANLFKYEGFYNKRSSNYEEDLYGKFLEYRFIIRIITSRLESDISEFIPLDNSLLESLGKSPELDLDKAEQLTTVLSKINLDVSDFYIYTRIFLDTLNMCIRHSFKHTGNKKWGVMTPSITGLLNENKMRTYKREIDFQFFEGLENKVSWIHNLKKPRDHLVHGQHHFVLTDTRQGEMGPDLIGKVKRIWGTEKVKPVLRELQGILGNISDLMNYLHKNLPRK